MNCYPPKTEPKNKTSISTCSHTEMTPLLVSEMSPMDSFPKMKFMDCLRCGFLLIMLVAATLGIFVFPSYLPSLLNWVRSQQLIGSIFFIFIQAICIWCVSPVSIFIIAAGFMYGLWYGSLVAYIGYVIGMLGSFILGKTLLRESIQFWLHEKYPSFESVDRAIGAQGFKVLILLRLSPVMPCNVMNYICSLTSISFPSYALASFFGVIPTVIIYANIGAIIGNISGESFDHVIIPKKSKDIMILLSCVFTTLSVVLIGIISKKALRVQLLPVVDEGLAISKEEMVEEERNFSYQILSSNGYFYYEKIVVAATIGVSVVTLAIGCTLIFNE